LTTLYTVAELRIVCCKVKQISTESLLRIVEKSLRNRPCINAQQLKKLTDGEDEKKQSSARIKRRSTKAKIHFEKTKSTSTSKPLLNIEDEEFVYDEVNDDNDIEMEDAQNNNTSK
jgi:hypothetical protein